jgi:rubrerythrin
MNPLTQMLHLVGSSASAYIMARNIRDPLTRPNTLAGLQLAESGAVPYLEALSQRAAAEGHTWLAEKLALHARDERRHGQIFAQALKQLNKQVIDITQKDKTQKDASSTQKEERRSPFFDTYYADYAGDALKAENVDWIVFLASTHILETDASKDFARMAQVLPDDPASVGLRKGLLSVAQDEEGHAAYLREALERFLPQAQVAAVIDEWRTRKVNAIWAMVGNFIQKNGKTTNLAQDGVPTESEAMPELEAVA